MQTRTYGDLFSLITNMIGAVELAADEQTQVKNFINRRYFEAYQSSSVWPRYLVVGEERDFSGGTQTVPFTQAEKDTINEFLRLHSAEPFKNNTVHEYKFYVDSDGASVINIVSGSPSSAYVTYKKTVTLPSVASDFYNSTDTIPEEFFNYIAHAVYADFLRVQNKQEEAIAEERVAEKYIAQEILKIDSRVTANGIKKRLNSQFRLPSSSFDASKQ